MNPSQESSYSKSAKRILPRIKISIKRILASDYFIKVAETFSTRVILIFLSLITGVVIARPLGPDGRGAFAMAMLVGTMGAQFSNLGLHSSNTLYIARDPSLLAPLLGNSLAISLGFGTIAAALGFALYIIFPGMIPIDETLFKLGLIWIPLSLTSLFLQNLLIGMQEIRTYNKIELVSKFFNIILLGIIIAYDLVSPGTVFLAALLTLPFSFLYALKFLYIFLKQRISLSITMFKKTLPYGIKSYIGSIIWFLLLRTDLYMVNKYEGEKSAGLYDVAFNLSETFYILPSIILFILFPKLCAIKNIQEKWILARKVGLCLTLILLLMFIVSSVLAEFIIVLLFGEAFIASTTVFILLIVGKILISINSIFSNFIASIHVPVISIPFNASIVVLNIYLNFILIKSYGMAGAALSSIICFGLLIPFHMYFTFKYLRNPETSMT
jgi:O-antigen/teichoic acid export membrane protein